MFLSKGAEPPAALLTPLMRMRLRRRNEADSRKQGCRTRERTWYVTECGDAADDENAHFAAQYAPTPDAGFHPATPRSLRGYA